MSRPYAWRVLGILPILKASACTNTDETWQRLRRLNLYHRCMDPIIAEINELCKNPRYYRWGDKLVRLGQAFWHFIGMDGLEIATTAALSSTMTCPTCECPKDELDRTDKLYPVTSTADVRPATPLVTVAGGHCQGAVTGSGASHGSSQLKLPRPPPARPRRHSAFPQFESSQVAASGGWPGPARGPGLPTASTL